MSIYEDEEEGNLSALFLIAKINYTQEWLLHMQAKTDLSEKIHLRISIFSPSSQTPSPQSSAKWKIYCGKKNHNDISCKSFAPACFFLKWYEIYENEKICFSFMIGNCHVFTFLELNLFSLSNIFRWFEVISIFFKKKE